MLLSSFFQSSERFQTIKPSDFISFAIIIFATTEEKFVFSNLFFPNSTPDERFLPAKV
jgi:hypothetical protein